MPATLAAQLPLPLPLVSPRSALQPVSPHCTSCCLAAPSSPPYLATKPVATPTPAPAQLDDPAAASALTKEALGALRAERDAASEAGVLRELLHEAVTVRHAKDNCTALLVRF